MSARILIVTDVPASVRLPEARLASEYYHVASAGSGPEAIVLMDEWPPDVILLDAAIPGIGAFELCQRLRARPRTSDIPIVVMTARGEPAEKARGLAAGADDFLSKPIEPDGVLTRVRGLVRLKRLRDEWRARAETACTLGFLDGFAKVPSIAGAQALIVDDWEFEAKLLREGLLREEVTCGIAHGEGEVLSLASATSFDLIVISLSIATADPLALASCLRTNVLTRDVPLLLIAEGGGRERLPRGLDLGLNDWLLRPLDESELRVRARNQIQRRLYQRRLRADLDHAFKLVLSDPLTGLYNQRYLIRHLGNLLASVPSDNLGVLMIDVDNLERVNDTYGRAMGDHALKAVAGTLRANLRVFDTLARHGGQRFVAVMPGAGIGEATGAGERLRDAVGQMRFQPYGKGSPHRLTVSIGVAAGGGVEQSAEALLQVANRALDGAKRVGRNRVEVALAG